MPGKDTPNNSNSSDSDSACQFQVSKDYSDLESDSECEPEFENPRKKKKQSPKTTAEAPPKGMVSKLNYRILDTLDSLDLFLGEESDTERCLQTICGWKSQRTVDSR